MECAGAGQETGVATKYAERLPKLLLGRFRVMLSNVTGPRALL